MNLHNLPDTDSTFHTPTRPDPADVVFIPDGEPQNPITSCAYCGSSVWSQTHHGTYTQCHTIDTINDNDEYDDPNHNDPDDTSEWTCNGCSRTAPPDLQGWLQHNY